MLAQGDRLAGHYVILEELGHGGMGRVYLALHEDLDARIALKELLVPGDADDLQIERFRAEGRMLHHLRHPRLPLVYDFFRDGEQYYIAMEFVEGRPLSQLLREQGTADAATVRQWGLQLCEVLDYLHSHEPVIVFRDLKPSNIMVTPKGELKLIDFGIAKLFDTERGGATSTAIRGAGTPGFAPLEQYGEGTDERADIYALGATLHSVATGRVPPSSVNLATGSAVLERLADTRPEFPADLCRLIHQMMAVRREDRPASIREVRARLSKPAGAMPVSAPLQEPVPASNEATGILPPAEGTTAIPLDGTARTSLPEPPTPSAYRFVLMLGSLVTVGVLVILLLSHFIRPSPAGPAKSPTVEVTTSPIAAASTALPASPHTSVTKHPKASHPKAARPVIVKATPTPPPMAMATPEGGQTVIVMPTATQTVVAPQLQPPPPPPVPTSTPDSYGAYQTKARAALQVLSMALELVPDEGKGPGFPLYGQQLTSALPALQDMAQYAKPQYASFHAMQDAYGSMTQIAKQWQEIDALLTSLRQAPPPPPGMGGGSGPPGGGPPPGGGQPPDPRDDSRVQAIGDRIRTLKSQAKDQIKQSQDALDKRD